MVGFVNRLGLETNAFCNEVLIKLKIGAPMIYYTPHTYLCGEHFEKIIIKICIFILAPLQARSMARLGSLSLRKTVKYGTALSG